MINGIFITIVSIGISISKKKLNVYHYFNIIEKLLNKLKNKKYHNQFQEYNEIQRNKIWTRHNNGHIMRIEKKKDRRKDFIL
jgi:hypothetical protein